MYRPHVKTSIVIERRRDVFARNDRLYILHDGAYENIVKHDYDSDNLGACRGRRTDIGDDKCTRHRETRETTIIHDVARTKDPA